MWNVQAGIILRAASRGYVPDKSFVIVTLLATFVLLLSWRATFAALGPKVRCPCMIRRLDQHEAPHWLMVALFITSDTSMSAQPDESRFSQLIICNVI